jgi:hypothetical protein
MSLCCTANAGIVPDSNKNAMNRNMGRVGSLKDVSQLSSMSEPRDFYGAMHQRLKRLSRFLASIQHYTDLNPC